MEIRGMGRSNRILETVIPPWRPMPSSAFG